MAQFCQLQRASRTPADPAGFFSLGPAPDIVWLSFRWAFASCRRWPGRCAGLVRGDTLSESAGRTCSTCICLTVATTACGVAPLPRSPDRVPRAGRPLSSQHVDPLRTQCNAVRISRVQVTTPRLDRRYTARPCRSPGTTRIARSSRPAPTAMSSQCLPRRRQSRPRRRGAGRRARSTASTTGASASSCAAAACDSPGPDTAATASATGQSNFANKGNLNRECERAR